MTIVYALIARGKAVLAEFTATAGNFPTVTRVLLNKIGTEATRMSYVSVLKHCYVTGFGGIGEIFFFWLLYTTSTVYGTISSCRMYYNKYFSLFMYIVLSFTAGIFGKLAVGECVKVLLFFS